MREDTGRKSKWKNRIVCLGLQGILVLFCACGSPMIAEEMVSKEIALEQTAFGEITSEETAGTETTAAVFGEETTESGETDLTMQEEITREETTGEDAPMHLMEAGMPVGHQIVYSDGEIYGWTRYEYDESGRKDMVIFITPTGNEYWSPVFYDGNGHVIPETVGDWAVLDEAGLHLEVGSEDSRGRRTPMAEYTYDDKGNLTDYWYMFVDGRYLRHTTYQYDSQDRVTRQETYYARNNRLESFVEYIYNGDGFLTRKNEVEDARRDSVGIYTVYQYDEEGRLAREEQIWGGRTHDYVEYFYNDNGVLIREYHFLEDPMMGGSYTVEYLFEAIDDSAG